MQWTIKRDRIDVAAIARFLREVDDNVQVVMTNEEQKEAGTEALPSLFFLLLLLSRSLSLCLSRFFFHKKIISSTYVCECAFLLTRTSNEKFSPIIIVFSSISMRACVRSFSFSLMTKEEGEEEEANDWMRLIFT